MTPIQKTILIVVVAIIAMAWCAAVAPGATIQVNPANVGSTVVGSNSGCTFNFSPGTYTLKTNPTGPAAVWPVGTYQGNGAVLSLSGGQDTTSKEVLVQFNGAAAATEFTGFVCTDAPIQCQNGAFNVHANRFQNTELGIFVAGNSGHIDGNTFAASVGQGIYGYPGTGGTYSNNTIAGTTGDDGIHLAGAAGNNTTISGNVITGCHRIPIEVQLSGSNIAVTNNYAALIQPATGSYMAFSIACGNANGVTVTGNTGVSDKPNLGACVEIMGNGANVSNNLSWGFAQGILNGAQGASLQASGNKIYGGVLAGNDATPWPIAPIVGTNTVLPLSAMPVAPAPPNVAQPPPAVIPTPPQTQPGAAVPQGITSAPGTPGAITVNAPAGSTLGLVEQNGTAVTIAPPATLAGTSGTITGIPAMWVLSVQVTAGGSTYTLPPIAQPATTPYATFAPVLVQAVPPATQPTITHVITFSQDGVPIADKSVYSDGSVR